MGILLPLFIVIFASIYLAMSLADPAAFGGELGRTQALYFTITVLSTVGFGDITPKIDAARVVTMIQMVLDLVVLAALAKLIVGAASHPLGPSEGLSGSRGSIRGIAAWSRVVATPHLGSKVRASVHPVFASNGLARH